MPKNLNFFLNSYLFARSSFIKYMEGYTAFHFSARPFMVGDNMPTLTICVKANETI